MSRRQKSLYACVIHSKFRYGLKAPRITFFFLSEIQVNMDGKIRENINYNLPFQRIVKKVMKFSMPIVLFFSYFELCAIVGKSLETSFLCYNFYNNYKVFDY